MKYNILLNLASSPDSDTLEGTVTLLREHTLLT